MKEKKTLEVYNFEINNCIGTYVETTTDVIKYDILLSFFVNVDVKLEIKSILNKTSYTLEQFLIFIFFISKEAKEKDKEFFFNLEQKIVRIMNIVNLNYICVSLSSLIQKKKIPYTRLNDDKIDVIKFFSQDKQEINNFGFILKNNIKILKESLYTNILTLEKEKKIYFSSSNSDCFFSKQEYKLLEKYLKSCDKITNSNKYNIFSLFKQFFYNKNLINNIKNYKNGIYFIQIKTYLSEILTLFRMIDIICLNIKSKEFSYKICEKIKDDLYSDMDHFFIILTEIDNFSNTRGSIFLNFLSQITYKLSYILFLKNATEFFQEKNF